MFSATGHLFKMTRRSSRQLTYQVNACNNSDDRAIVVNIIEDVQHRDAFTLFSLWRTDLDSFATITCKEKIPNDFRYSLTTTLTYNLVYNYYYPLQTMHECSHHVCQWWLILPLSPPGLFSELPRCSGDMQPAVDREQSRTSLKRAQTLYTFTGPRTVSVVSFINLFHRRNELSGLNSCVTLDSFILISFCLTVQSLSYS